MTSSSYFRYPHLHGDSITFVAQDDVWIAPLAGGRAWRISSEGSPPRNPRFSPDGSRLLWTVTRGEAPEVVSVPVSGGEIRQLTFWGHASTLVKGFTPDGDVLVTSAFEQPDSRLTWAYAIGLATGMSTLLPFGPVDSVAYGPVLGDERPVVLSTVLSREPAAWKRYRGGTSGKLWSDADGSGEFVRLASKIDGNLCDPMWIDGRIAFLSDHEGHGNLYSVLPDGSGLRRHTDFEGFYIRHATTDGARIVFESAGNLFLMDGLDSEAVLLDITVGATAPSCAPQLLKVSEHLGDVVPLKGGLASVVESYGTVHLLTHRDGPARVIAAEHGVRARLARPLGDEHVMYIADRDGEDSLYLQAVAEPVRVTTEKDVPGAADPAVGVDGQTQTSGGFDGEHTERKLPQPVSALTFNDATGNVSKAGHSPDQLATRSPEQLGVRAEEAVDGADDSPIISVPTAVEHDAGLRRINFPTRTRAANALPSPDGSKVAIGTESGEVFLVDLAQASMELVAQTLAGPVEELAFSPDSSWLVWTEPLDNGEMRSRLRMASTDVPEGGRIGIIELTDGRFADSSPVFTPDGKFVAFLSRRSFDPVYDSYSFDLAFPLSTKPFLIALAAVTPSPFGPSIAGKIPSGSNTATIKAPGGSEGTLEDPKSTVVDIAGLAARIIAVPVRQDRYTALAAVDGALLWQVDPSAGETGDGLAMADSKKAAASLERFDFVTGKTTRIVEELDRFRLSSDGQWLVTVKEENVKVGLASASGTEDAHDFFTVDLERILYKIEPVKVWGQAFDEAWRLQRDFYYTPDMAGTDWDGVYARYRPIVERLGSHNDLVDLLWEMHGELGTSHAYVTPAPLVEKGAGAQGYLGASFQATAAGFVIQEILGGDSSDPQAFSPMAAPGVAVQVGEILEAINGVPVPPQGPQVLLAGTAGRIIELTLRSADDGQGDDQAEAPTRRRVAVVPLKSEERLRYQLWVAANRATVHKASNGTFGYLHVPDMMSRGWAQLHRDLDTQTAADALVVDVRRNRGGHTSELVAEVLGRRMDAWSLARGHQPSIYPSQALRGPVIVLSDEFAGSDGDIITAVAKLRGIGPVIGMRTWGGVVGIDGRFKLVDGTAVTQPRYAFWFRGGQGFNVENYGVDPDIEVPFPPHDHGAGNDPQLEAAIGVLKEMQREIPTVHPPVLDGYRNVAPAPLPPRPE